MNNLIEKLLAGESVRDLILDEAAPKLTRDEIQQLDVDAIIPDQKDAMRADGLSWHGSTFHGNGAPFAQDAKKMANLITDPYKLVRRSKAVVAKWGTDPYNGENVWEPFRRRLMDLGFSGDQIRKIADYTE